MLSLSDNEFAVLNFLVRNFTERLTIRNLAQKLKFSPAGVHTILKKLEKQDIVYGEKLGTGLFYKVNFDNKTAYHLAAAVLVGFFELETKKIPFENYFSSSKSVLFDKKTTLFIVDNISIASFDVANADVSVKTEDEFIEAIKKRDPLILSLLKNSAVVFGEEFIINVIRKFIERF